ncbi:MAG: helix-turn-helix transcriptional regulator [Chitinophagaceae bacterium]
MDTVGENIRLARKRRKLSTYQVAGRAAIDRGTLANIEKGNSSISIRDYFTSSRVLNFQEDLFKLATDDVLTRKLQNLKRLGK